MVLVKKTHFIELDQHHPVCANFDSRSHPSSAEEGIFRSPCNSFTFSFGARAKIVAREFDNRTTGCTLQNANRFAPS